MSRGIAAAVARSLCRNRNGAHLTRGRAALSMEPGARCGRDARRGNPERSCSFACRRLGVRLRIRCFCRRFAHFVGT